MSLERLLAFWRHPPQISENIVHWEAVETRLARREPLPPALHTGLAKSLEALGIRDLYAHQAQSWDLAGRGRNLVVSTGTASGKTLCYNLPVLDRLLRLEQARALYLFPTKALAQDQLSGIRRLIPRSTGGIMALLADIYDGDTPRSKRPSVRENARLVLSLLS